MSIKASEISDLIKARISQFDAAVEELVEEWCEGVSFGEVAEEADAAVVVGDGFEFDHFDVA